MRDPKNNPATILLQVALLGLLWCGAGAHADIFKCVAANGEVTYRDSPCPHASDTLQWQRGQVVLPSSAVLPAVEPEPPPVPETRIELGNREFSVPAWLRPPDAAQRRQYLQALTDLGHRGPPLWQVLLGVYALMSVLCFITYGMDKRAAQAGRRRVPESRLHWLEFLGGWPGALLAQQVFRHKTSKGGYQFDFWLIVGAHGLLWLDYLLGFPLLGAIGRALS